MAIFSSIIAGIATAFTAISGFIGGLGAIGSFLLKTVVGIGLSYAAQALAGKKEAEQPKFSVQGKLQTGGDIPRSFPIGFAGTAGSLVYANTWGLEVNDSPNTYLTYVIALSDLPVNGLAELWANGELCTVDWEDDSYGEWGFPVLNFQKDEDDNTMWIKFYDGTQTVADPFLVNTVSSLARPYQSTRVGKGIAYAIITCQIKPEIYTGFPQFKFALEGIKLYDPSKDTTAGGVGSQRWAEPSTWGGDGDHFPVVQAYNMLRGIYYNNEWFYGVQSMSGARLPDYHWIEQINKCRGEITSGGSTKPTYRSGGEIPVSAELGDTLSALMTACQGRITESGGVYKAFVGAPGASVFAFTDDHILSTEEQSFTPFYGLSDTINGINGKYPNPSEGWNVKVAPPLYRTDLEVLAGNRRMMADTSFDLVPYGDQVQRLMKSALEEAQRARRHTIVLPPEAYVLEPGDTVTWDSTRNGYVAKQFRVDGVVDKTNLDVILDITEVDPSDYDWNDATDYTPEIDGPLIISRPPIQPIIDWDASPASIPDSAGTGRKPAILLEWDGNKLDIVGVTYEVRLASTSEVIYRGRTDDYLAGSILISQNLVPNTAYHARGRYVPGSDRDVQWSNWLPVTTPNILVQAIDILDGAINELKLADRAVSTLKIKLLAVTEEIIANEAVVSSKMADLAVTNAKIAAGAVSNPKLLDNIISADKIMANAVTELKLLNSAVTLNKISANAVDASKLQSNAVTELKLAANAVTEAKVAVGAISELKIAAGAVTATRLADAAVTLTKFAAGLTPVEVVGALPSTGNFAGRTVFLTTDGKTYRHTGTPSGAAGFTAAVSTVDLSGQINTAQISDSAITLAKVANGAITSVKISDDAITAPKILAGAITTDKVAANAIIASKIFMTDLTNMVKNPIFQDAVGAASLDNWASGTSSATVTNLGGDPAQPSQFALTFPQGAASYRDQSTVTGAHNNSIDGIPVSAGETYYISAWSWISGSGPGADPGLTYVQMLLYDNTSTFVTGPSFSIAPTLGWSFIQGQITIPSGNGKYARLRVGRGVSTTGGTIFVTKLVVRKAANAELIVDGAISALKIQANSINGDHIQANAITAGKIQAGAIGTDQLAANAVTAGIIAAGAITTDKLASGRGANFIENSDMAAGLANWGATGGGGTVSLSLRQDSYAPPGGALQLTELTASTAGSWVWHLNADGTLKRFNVIAGDKYDISVYVSSHRCTGQVVARWYDAAGSFISDSYSPMVGNQNINNQYLLSNYARSSAIVTAPANAVKCDIRLQRTGTLTGENSYCWFVNVMLAKASPYQTEPAPWSPAGITLVSGGHIITNAITAGHIEANAVTAVKIFAGSISTEKLSAGAVTAEKITGATITGDKLVVNAITSRELILTNFTNMIPNPSFIDGGASWMPWGTPSNVTFPEHVTYPGGRACRLAANEAIVSIFSHGSYTDDNLGVPVVPDERYLLSAEFFSTATNGGTLTAYWKYRDGTYSANNLVIPTVGSWNRRTLEVTVPPNAKKLNMYVVRNAGGTGDLYFGNAAITRRMDATLIVDGAITTDKLLANAVVSDKIAANAVTADKIVANSITSREMYITDFTNLVTDPYFAKQSAWAAVGEGFTFQAGAAAYSGATTVLQKTGASSLVAGMPFRVNAGDEYLVVGIVNKYTATAGVVRVWLQFLSDAGVGVGGTILLPSWTTADPGAYTKKSAYGPVPSTATQARLIIDSGGGAVTGVYRIGFAGVYKKNAAELIVDGAITAGKIAALSISSGDIAAGAIVAGKIGVNAVTASNIVAGSITALELGADSVTSVKIAAGSIVASKMVSNQVSSLFATFGTMTAGLIRSANSKMQVDLDNVRILMSDDT